VQPRRKLNGRLCISLPTYQRATKNTTDVHIALHVACCCDNLAAVTERANNHP
jgi:hypothetical protein